LGVGNPPRIIYLSDPVNATDKNNTKKVNLMTKSPKSIDRASGAVV
jgi:hypothetical protein